MPLTFDLTKLLLKKIRNEGRREPPSLQGREIEEGWNREYRRDWDMNFHFFLKMKRGRGGKIREIERWNFRLRFGRWVSKKKIRRRDGRMESWKKCKRLGRVMYEPTQSYRV